MVSKSPMKVSHANWRIAHRVGIRITHREWAEYKGSHGCNGYLLAEIKLKK